MAQIGTFTRGEDGSFTGQIRTLNISTKATIRPVAKEGERSPDYRVAANGVELGAGWSKTAKDTGAEYVSVSFRASAVIMVFFMRPPFWATRVRNHLVSSEAG